VDAWQQIAAQQQQTAIAPQARQHATPHIVRAEALAKPEIALREMVIGA
jgi:hypothetical protein